MKITLEVLEEHNRSNPPVECYPCGRRFVVGSVVALRFSNDDSPHMGEVCPKCLAAGPEEMRKDLECRGMDTTGSRPCLEDGRRGNHGTYGRGPEANGVHRGAVAAYERKGVVA